MRMKWLLMLRSIWRFLAVLLLVTLVFFLTEWWLAQPGSNPAYALAADVIAVLLVMSARYQWARLADRYRNAIRISTIAALFALVMLAHYHLQLLGYGGTALYFVPILVAVFDFGIGGGLLASLGAMLFVLVPVLAYPFDSSATPPAFLEAVAGHAVLYVTISIAAGWLLSELRLQSERYQVIVEAAENGVIMVDGRGEVTLFNKAAEALFGRSRDEVLGRPDWRALYSGQKYDEQGKHTSLLAKALEHRDSVRGAEQIIRGPGGKRVVQVDAHVIEGPGKLPVGAYAIFRDLTAQRHDEDQALVRAFQDRLTGLANRRQADKEVAAELTRAGVTGRPVAAILVDLDQFTQLNRDFGQAVGDAALRAVARRLQEHAPVLATVARFGPDEFLLLLPERDFAAALQLAEQIRTTIEQMALAAGDQVVRLTVSLGVAEYPKSCQSADQLLVAAGAALYQAKYAGYNRVAGSESPPGKADLSHDPQLLAGVAATLEPAETAPGPEERAAEPPAAEPGPAEAEPETSDQPAATSASDPIAAEAPGESEPATRRLPRSPT